MNSTAYGSVDRNYDMDNLVYSICNTRVIDIIVYYNWPIIGRLCKFVSIITLWCCWFFYGIYGTIDLYTQVLQNEAITI